MCPKLRDYWHNYTHMYSQIVKHFGMRNMGRGAQMHKTASILSNRRKKCSHINNKDWIKRDWFSKQRFLESVISDKYANRNCALLGDLLYLGYMGKWKEILWGSISGSVKWGQKYAPKSLWDSNRVSDVIQCYQTFTCL